MKIMKLFIVMFLGYTTCSASQIMLKSCIVSPDLETLPPFTVYYRGMKTFSNSDGFFSIPLDTGKSNHYNLLICKQFNQNFDSGNTVKSLSVSSQKPYNFYSITKATLHEIHNRVQQLKMEINLHEMQVKLLGKQIEKQKIRLEQLKQQGEKHGITYNLDSYTGNIQSLDVRKLDLQYKLANAKKEHEDLKVRYGELQNKPENELKKDFWLITKSDLVKENYIVPDDCVVLNMNLKNVDRIENWKFSLPSNFVAFPRIVLKKGIEIRNVKRKQSLTRSSLKAELNFEANVFHEQKKEEIKKFSDKPNVIVALVR